MRKAFLQASAATLLAAFVPAVASAQRGQRGSNRNLAAIRARLNGIIDSLQADTDDYGGHKASAIHHLQEAQAELTAALRSR